MEKIKEITKRVLKKIKPSPSEISQFQKTTQNFLKKLNLTLKEIKAEAILGGSGAKGTWLKNSREIDIFVLFDYQIYKEKSSSLADILEEKLNKEFKKLKKIKIKRLIGSRDYFQIWYHHYLWEIVPLLKISQVKEAVNITDVSPFHVQWVKKASSRLKDQIRLAKQFCKANSCYGAESYISGFSGYVLEILVIYYGSFEKLLQAAVSWKNKEIIDIEKYYQKEEVFKKINPAKLNSPLIVIDPVDKQRNAAAALNMEKFLLFKKRATQFLQKPSLSFFEKKKLSFPLLEKQTPHNLVYLEIKPLPGKKDVIGNKLLQAFVFLKKNLKKFHLLETGWDWPQKNKAIFYFILEKKQLPPYSLKKGPPLKFKKHLQAFQKKHKETFIAGGRLIAKIPLKNFLLADFLRDLLKEKYFQEKIREIKILKIKN